MFSNFCLALFLFEINKTTHNEEFIDPGLQPFSRVNSKTKPNITDIVNDPTTVAISTDGGIPIAFEITFPTRTPSRIPIIPAVTVIIIDSIRN